MARFARVVVVDVAHHVTQRGNARQFILSSEVATLRQYTHTGRPLGSETFVADLEHSTLRALIPRKAGRPKKRVQDARQDGFTFAA